MKYSASEALNMVKECGLNIEEPPHNEVLNIVIEALEKQIPKKLLCIGIEQCCPVCKEAICLIGDDGCYGNFCSNCGQALDWSDAE